MIFEDLNFQSPSLSKKLNRILQNFGKGIITKKLEQIEEEYGIKTEFVNPMYSSQSCSKCDYVDKNNRKGQEEFSCIYCNLEKNRKKLKLNIVDFTKGLTIEITKNKTNSNIKFFYLDKKLNMKLVKINADYNASINIYGRSSSVKNDTIISLYDKKAVVLGKITDSFVRKLPESHYSLIEDLGNSYFNNYFHGKRTNNSIKILNKSK